MVNGNIDKIAVLAASSTSPKKRSIKTAQPSRPPKIPNPNFIIVLTFTGSLLSGHSYCKKSNNLDYYSLDIQISDVFH